MTEDVELGDETLLEMLDLHGEGLDDLIAIELYDTSDYSDVPEEYLGLHTPEKGLDILTRSKLECSYGERDSTPGVPHLGIYAWTKTRVIYSREYDTSYTLRSIPRNPEDSQR